MPKRCAWAPADQPLYLAYHDEEWGVPLHDERRLFEMLILEGAQAGLAWITILRKRENYRRAFDGQEPSDGSSIVTSNATVHDEVVQRLSGP